MKRYKSLGVFCGASAGVNPAFVTAAQEFAATLVAEKISLIFGGGNCGLMGVLANTVLEKGGEVIGVIPRFLVEHEIAHAGVSKLHIVETMHERKNLIAELSDGFVMLPGGPGTFDEFFEMYTWAYLGIHDKPCGILNTENYYDALLKFLDHGKEMGFMTATQRDMLVVEHSPQKLLQALAMYQVPKVFKWMDSRDALIK